MAAGSIDPVLAELRKLREGVGLTLDRLKASGSVMSALATSDPVEALSRLTDPLGRLASGDRASALRVDFGIDLNEAAKKKMALNAEHYPAHKARGNARKYTEL